MLFCIAGAQGSGKSTTLDRLYEETTVQLIERKTARSILTDWDLSLDQIYNDRRLHMKFQDELLKRKMDDERNAANDQHNVYFTERSYSDLFVYALQNLGKYNECSEWLNSYYGACKKANETYRSVYYLPSGQFSVYDDGVRSINEHFSRMVDITLQHYTHDMNTRVVEVTGVAVNQRVQGIEEDFKCQ